MLKKRFFNCNLRYILLFITIAFNNPFPLTSVTTLCWVNFFTSSRNIFPIFSAFSANFSSSNTLRAVMATLEPNGLPPKVEPCVPNEININVIFQIIVYRLLKIQIISLLLNRTRFLIRTSFSIIYNVVGFRKSTILTLTGIDRMFS